MNKTIVLQIPLGFVLKEEKRVMDILAAEQLLLTRKKKQYTMAVREDQTAILYNRYVVCPRCGASAVANTGSWLLPQHLRKDCASDNRQIKAWAQTQMQLFEDRQSERLLLYEPVSEKSRVCCPVCDYGAPISKQTRQVELRITKNKLTLKSQVLGIQELLQPGWLKGKRLRLSASVFEELTFDLHRGCIYVRLEDGTTRLCRDVTQAPELLESGACWQALRHRTVLRSVSRWLACGWGKPLPYSNSELDVDKLCLLTRFQGYPKSFYVAIPFAQDSRRLYGSFRARAAKLRRSEDALCYLETLDLPKAKTVRRLLFEKPGLFFYLEELQILWRIVADPNLFCRLLNDNGAYQMLSGLHMQPGIVTYLTDYCRVRGAKLLCDGLLCHWWSHYTSAQSYGCMSRYQQEETQKSWSRKEKAPPQERGVPVFSLPMHPVDQRIPNCQMEEYSFTWLETSNDYLQAGRALNNCLRQWNVSYDPVMVVKYRGKYRAAIQIAGNRILQARTHDNRSLEERSPLYRVIEKWRLQNGLQWGARVRFDDAWDDLPMPF